MRAQGSASLPAMKRAPVESSSIASVGYDVATRTLEVEFVHGAVYRYLELPADVHVAFWAADSKGRFLNEAIRDSYACIKLL